MLMTRGRAVWRRSGVPTARVNDSSIAVLMYHGVPGTFRSRRTPRPEIDRVAFTQQLRALKREVLFVPLDECEIPPTADRMQKVALTFDDGLKNHAEIVAPILRSENVPATFFVCKRNSEAHHYLWFTYLNALECYFTAPELLFLGARFDMTPPQRAISVRALMRQLLSMMPHPEAMYEAIEDELPRLEDFVPKRVIEDCYAGLTERDIRDLASEPLFTVSAHTLDHPYLTRCSRAEMRRQIVEGKAWVETVTQRPCAQIAYPAGVYDDEVLHECEAAGYSRGFCITSKRQSPLLINRIGVYRQSSDILRMKIRWRNQLRTLGFQLG